MQGIFATVIISAGFCPAVCVLIVEFQQQPQFAIFVRNSRQRDLKITAASWPRIPSEAKAALC